MQGFVGDTCLCSSQSLESSPGPDVGSQTLGHPRDAVRRETKRKRSERREKAYYKRSQSQDHAYLLVSSDSRFSSEEASLVCTHAVWRLSCSLPGKPPGDFSAAGSVSDV